MSVTTSLDGHVGWITLNRPDRMNAITVDLARALRDSIGSLGADPAVNVIVIREAVETSAPAATSKRSNA